MTFLGWEGRTGGRSRQGRHQGTAWPVGPGSCGPTPAARGHWLGRRDHERTPNNGWSVQYDPGHHRGLVSPDWRLVIPGAGNQHTSSSTLCPVGWRHRGILELTLVNRDILNIWSVSSVYQQIKVQGWQHFVFCMMILLIVQKSSFCNPTGSFWNVQRSDFFECAKIRFLVKTLWLIWVFP